VKWLIAFSIGVAAAGVIMPCVARAQPVAVLSLQTSPADEARPSTQETSTSEPGGFKRFLVDVGHDYRDYFSWETAGWLAGGGVAAAAVHTADEQMRQATEDPEAALTRAFEAGSTGATYGNLSFQFPLAVGWWTIGHFAGSRRGADAGRDLVRAQISALSWTYAFKFIGNRERPNGDPRSFPSGHASATFATAMVLQEHYGWKLGLPVFAAAALTAASRITVDKHWTSDVVFGAVVGLASGRTVTLHVRQREFALGPITVPGGGGIAVRLVN
jgi:hypothetical protein